MTTVLVDTGPLVALAVRRDRHHEACKAFLKSHRGRLLTTWAVLTEFSHLVPSVEAAVALYRWIASGGLDVFPLGRDEIVKAVDWIERYADQPMDLADASLVMASLGTGYTRIWTLDRRDFETWRLPGRRRFQLVESA